MSIIKIFNTLEIEVFESPPVFNHAERKKFFTLPSHLQQKNKSFRTPTNQVCFILMTGYFRARNKFFGKQFHAADLEFVTTRLGLNLTDVKPSTYDKQTIARHQQMLLDFFGYNRFDKEARNLLTHEIANLVRAHIRPKIILLESIEFLLEHRISLPGYSTLADLIGIEINRHKHNLMKIVSEHLNDTQRHKLDSLLEKDTVIAEGTVPQVQRYKLTLFCFR